MVSFVRSLVSCRPCLAVLLILCGLAGTARAEPVTVANNTSGAFVVQSAVLIRGVPQYDRQILVRPGQTVLCTVQPGTKVLSVCDPRNTNRPLLQAPIPPSDTPQAYVIKPDPRGGIRLVPADTPPPP
jgi:hypothetical protein